jgi:RHS repeat-associated protein
VDGNGEVTMAKSYQPYGTEISSVGNGLSSYGFTGEMTDPTGLIYLRARYYSGDTGRFISYDTWGGNYNRPLSLNRWNYTNGNPVNYTDPSGHCSPTGDDWCINHDPRDLTDWMVREMLADAQDPRVEKIRQLYKTGLARLGLAAELISDGLDCNNSIAIIRGEANGLFGGVENAAGLLEFRALVKDHAPFDPKHKIKEYLGQGITLGNQNNIEYSVTGNIVYGFIGASIGYPDILLYYGAGYAEINDPAHDRKKAAKLGVDYLPYTGDQAPPYYGDTHGDYNAIAFGIHLYKTYGVGLTLASFRTEFPLYSSGLDRHQAASWPVPPFIADQWPYPVGYFDPTR